MRPAAVADEERVAVREVARAGGLAVGRDESPVGVLRTPGRDALRDDAARRVLAQMIILVPESTCCIPFEMAME
jgi:hypothetical protein